MVTLLGSHLVNVSHLVQVLSSIISYINFTSLLSNQLSIILYYSHRFLPVGNRYSEVLLYTRYCVSHLS